MNEGSPSTKLWGGGETAGSETKDDRFASGEIWLASSEAEAPEGEVHGPD